MSGPALTELQEQAVDRVARFIVRFGLGLPAILSLESMRPLNRVGAQFMHLLTPSVTAVLPGPTWAALAELLEEPGGLDVLLQRIEDLDRLQQEPPAR